MAINKVEANGQTLIDLTSDTVTADSLLEGKTAHNRSGAVVTGTMTPSKAYVATFDDWVWSSGHAPATSLQKGELAAAYTSASDHAGYLAIALRDNAAPFDTTQFLFCPTYQYTVSIANSEAAEVFNNKFSAIMGSSLNHNGIYRGKDLTNVYTPAQIKSKISGGTFDDLYLGDYFEMTLSDSKKCRLEIAHFNYYKDRGVNKPHVVFIVGYSDGYAGAATGTNGTAGQTTGYYNSTIHTTTLPAWVSKVETALGYSLTSFNERLSSAVNTSINSMLRQPNGSSMTGCVSSMTWATLKAVLPNSMQVYGESICSNTVAEMGLSTEKFALFNFEQFWYNNPISDVTESATAATTSIWLRDVYGDGYLLVDVLGKPGRRGVDAGAMLRPYVIIS